ncbi:Histone-lysine N-methyltransferase SETD1A, partial [Eudyptes moseleyi]
EDMRFLRVTYERLLQEDSGTHWLNDTHWVHHTDILPGAGRRAPGAWGRALRGPPHPSCRDHVPRVPWAVPRVPKAVMVSSGPCLRPQVPPGCPRGCSPPRNDTCVCVCPPLPQFRKKRLRFGRSRIHEWGLFAMEPIAADEMVIEYVGQNIRQV